MQDTVSQNVVFGSRDTFTDARLGFGAFVL